MIHASRIKFMVFAAFVATAAIVAGCADTTLLTAASTPDTRVSGEAAGADMHHVSTPLQPTGAQNELASRQASTADQAKRDLKDSEDPQADAPDEKAGISIIEKEERELVVALSGSVLFRSAESSLLPEAWIKLDQVTRALLSVGERSIVVEGYTDSRGSDTYNQNLSQRRADAVREYIVKRGYPADRIQSYGMGKGSPIANNASPEGRSSNRRVEIVIKHKMQTSARSFAAD